MPAVRPPAGAQTQSAFDGFAARQIVLVRAAAEPDFFHDYCERVFKTLGYTPERLPEPPDHAALLGLVACGQGVALVPQSLTNVQRKGVVFRPLVEADQRRIRIGLAVCSGPLSPPVQGLVDLIKAGQSANAAGTSHR